MNVLLTQIGRTSLPLGPLQQCIWKSTKTIFFFKKKMYFLVETDHWINALAVYFELCVKEFSCWPKINSFECIKHRTGIRYLLLFWLTISLFSLFNFFYRIRCAMCSTSTPLIHTYFYLRWSIYSILIWIENVRTSYSAKPTNKYAKLYEYYTFAPHVPNHIMLSILTIKYWTVSYSII